MEVWKLIILYCLLPSHSMTRKNGVRLKAITRLLVLLLPVIVIVVVVVLLLLDSIGVPDVELLQISNPLFL